MNNDLRPIKTILWNIISVSLSAVSLLIIENYIGNQILNFWIIVPIVIFVVLIIIFSVTLYINKVTNDIMSKNIVDNECKTCDYNNSICCGDETFEHLKNDYTLVPGDELKKRIFNRYSLIYKMDLIKNVEQCFYKHDGKEVWIVSSHLGTELTDEAVDFVADNLKNGIIYKEFYAEKSHDGTISMTAAIYANKLKEMYDNSDNLHLITYDKEISLEGFIFEMYGVVIYYYKDGHYEMYYSVRKNGLKPIYYKAPECMANNYFYILSEIYNKSKK